MEHGTSYFSLAEEGLLFPPCPRKGSGGSKAAPLLWLESWGRRGQEAVGDQRGFVCTRVLF